jgi:hypothetical protein
LTALNDSAASSRSVVRIETMSESDAAKAHQLNNTPTLLDHALALADCGFPVFPLQPRSKDPYPKTRGLLDASTDPDLIRRWWSVPGAECSNIGIRPPEGIVVVDVDPRHAGHVTLERLEAKHGELPTTLTARTGGGGLHAFYRVPGELAWPKALKDGPDDTGLDLKGPRGYVLAAPSVHPDTGQLYEWLTPLGTPIAEAPAWLVAKGYVPTEAVIVEDEDEAPAQPDEAIAAMVSQLTPAYGEANQRANKHAMAFALGGWLKQRGWNQRDVARVVEQLPSRNPRARVNDAMDGFKVGKPHGWHELKARMGEGAAAQLDASAANPRRQRELEERAAAQELVPAMAAAAMNRAAALPLVPANDLAAVAHAPSAVDQWPTIEVPTIFEPLGAIDYLIQELDLCPGAPALIAGYGFSAKSFAAQELCMAVATGDKAFGLFACKRGRAVYVDREQGPRLTRERFQRLARARGVPPDALAGRLAIVNMPPIGLDAPAATIEPFLVDRFKGTTLAVFDSLKAFCPSLDENDSKIRGPLDMLTRVSLATGCTFAVIHHARKPADGQRGGARMAIRGSGAIYDGCSSVLVFEAEPGQPTQVSHQKARNSGKPTDPFTLRVVDIANGELGSMAAAMAYDQRWGVRVTGDLQGPESESRERKAEAAAAELGPKILAWLGKYDPEHRGERSEEIATGIGVRRALVDFALRGLRLAGDVEQRKRGNAHLWLVPVTPAALGNVAPPAVPGFPLLGESRDAERDPRVAAALEDFS